MSFVDATSNDADRDSVIAALQADLRHRERQIEAIRRTSEALFSHPSVDRMIEATLTLALDVLRADAGTVFLHDPREDTLVFRYVIGGAAQQLMGTAIPATQGGVAWTVFQSGAPMLTGDVTERGDFNREVDRRTGYQTQSMMTVPVRRTDGAPIGVMQVLNASVAFNQRDLEVLQVLCAQAATGIEHAQLLEARRNAEIGNRVGEIAHDIKNMMTPIETGVLTLQGDLSAPLQTYDWLLDDILTGAQRVRRRTEYIAGMVKGSLPPPIFEDGDLAGLIRDVAKTLARTARDSELQLVTEIAPDLPRLAFDYDQLFDALYNLVNNAIPETPRGGTVTVRARELDPDSVSIVVRDTGRGIPPHVLERLFTNTAISTKVGGTGLGTSVAARVVREHGGTIAVDSTLGQGTTFTIRLPRTGG